MISKEHLRKTVSEMEFCLMLCHGHVLRWYFESRLMKGKLISISSGNNFILMFLNYYNYNYDVLETYKEKRRNVGFWFCKKWDLWNFYFGVNFCGFDMSYLNYSSYFNRQGGFFSLHVPCVAAWRRHRSRIQNKVDFGRLLRRTERRTIAFRSLYKIVWLIRVYIYSLTFGSQTSWFANW
jgi:hypothetical protein